MDFNYFFEKTAMVYSQKICVLSLSACANVMHWNYCLEPAQYGALRHMEARRCGKCPSVAKQHAMKAFHRSLSSS